MKIRSLELEAVAVKPHQYPQDGLPEFAFAGRSNVGKSSFINSMLNRKNIARTSGKPGKTRTINFYRVNDELRLVDLPGYGYAVASKKDKDEWARTINTYLGNRENLKELILLVDMRHAPSAQDQEMYRWIVESGFAGLVVATKADKLSRRERPQALQQIRRTLEMENTDLIIPYSAVTKENIPTLWSILMDMVDFHKNQEEEIEEQ
ncbi:ribosome biogenesis GTP-binding protein YihA/YsxC [Peptoniphilus sp. KCTC 25270]|uniref:ribosome biogenesis GTP-binding protein YihA/YsxC n=1 Tax=Peptoniphilus sp. KCTC 25270 TaxID=2897414 RepID=UPI001E28CDCC|nr:ribosome biogenesis GTP-binding protein YihA/YsxC [Peptoniphilus sp. KCTC 25270]